MKCSLAHCSWSKGLFEILKIIQSPSMIYGMSHESSGASLRYEGEAQSPSLCEDDLTSKTCFGTRFSVLVLSNQFRLFCANLQDVADSVLHPTLLLCFLRPKAGAPGGLALLLAMQLDSLAKITKYCKASDRLKLHDLDFPLAALAVQVDSAETATTSYYHYSHS